MKHSLILAAALALAACGTPTPTAQTTTRIFYDDFSQDLRLWETFAEVGALSQIADGRLTITVANRAAFAFTMAALNVTDFDLSVSTTFVSGGHTNSYGVIFRYVDSQNFYRFDVSGDGLWGLSRRQADQWISLQELQPATPINHSVGAVNSLRVVGRGSEFAFYANGIELGQLSDNNLPVGRIGLFASTFDDPNAEVGFDDINIVKP